MDKPVECSLHATTAYYMETIFRLLARNSHAALVICDGIENSSLVVPATTTLQAAGYFWLRTASNSLEQEGLHIFPCKASQ